MTEPDDMDRVRQNSDRDDAIEKMMADYERFQKAQEPKWGAPGAFVVLLIFCVFVVGLIWAFAKLLT